MLSGKAASPTGGVVISMFSAAEVGTIIFSDFFLLDLAAIRSQEHQMSPKSRTRPKKARTVEPPVVWVTHASCDVRRAMCGVSVAQSGLRCECGPERFAAWVWRMKNLLFCRNRKWQRVGGGGGIRRNEANKAALQM